jgi:hypothetical protein
MTKASFRQKFSDGRQRVNWVECLVAENEVVGLSKSKHHGVSFIGDCGS